MQCIMRNGHMARLPLLRGQVDTYENITFPQLRWLAVIITIFLQSEHLYWLHPFTVSKCIVIMP